MCSTANWPKGKKLFAISILFVHEVLNKKHDVFVCAQKSIWIDLRTGWYNSLARGTYRGGFITANFRAFSFSFRNPKLEDSWSYAGLS